MVSNNENWPVAPSFELANQFKQESNPYSQEYIDDLIKLTSEQFVEINNLKSRLANIEIELEKALENNVEDSLTGCLNIKFYEKYKIENFDPDHDREKIALVYIDLNGVKSTNDTYGHQAGDQMIVDAANLFKEQFRAEDIVIRLHGDEFVVICRDRKDGIEYERLKARVDDIRNLALNLERPLSFATGVAVFDSQYHKFKISASSNETENRVDANLGDTEVRAEQEMYRVKIEMKAGR